MRHQALVDCLRGPDRRRPQRSRQTSRAGDPGPAADAQRRAVGGRILLAEDNEINALLATTILEEAGFSVEAVVNGAEAVEAAGRGGFDLILMDVQMPVMDGLQATREIRALRGPAASVPIVALTANAMRSDQDACLGAGMNDFVSKPLDPDDFLGAVRRFVGERGGGADGAAAEAGRRVPRSRRFPARRPDEADAGGAAARHHRGLPGRGAEPAAAHRGVRRSGDLVGLAREAHDLKGVSGNFGARRLQHLADKLEQVAKASDQPQAKALTLEVRRASITAWDLVGRRLAELGGEPEREVA